MSEDTRNAPSLRFYKICALLGTLIIFSDISYSLIKIQSFENTVTQVFESMVTNQMELDGLQQELQHIEKVVEQAQNIEKDKNVEVDGISYSPYEVERLRNEKASMMLVMQEKQLDLVGENINKKSIMNEVRILFLGSLIFLVFGTLLAAFGYVAWYFRIELFEDRRKKNREI